MYDRDWQIQISYPNFSESKWRCSNVGKNIPKNSDSIFEFPDSKDRTIHAKKFSLFYTELKLLQF